MKVDGLEEKPKREIKTTSPTLLIRLLKRIYVPQIFVRVSCKIKLKTRQ